MGARPRNEVRPQALPRPIAVDTAGTNAKGSGFELQAQHRTLIGGEEETYWACDSQQAHVTRLYRDAGLQGCSSHGGRRTFATRLVAQGQSIETVQRLLGHADIDHTDDYLDVDRRTLAEMFSGAI